MKWHGRHRRIRRLVYQFLRMAEFVLDVIQPVLCGSRMGPSVRAEAAIFGDEVMLL